MLKAPMDDVECARENGLRFSVATKAKPRARWEEVAKDIPDLMAAMELAGKTVAHEVAVFLENEFGGFMYWTSSLPHLFTSTILRAKIVAAPGED